VATIQETPALKCNQFRFSADMKVESAREKIVSAMLFQKNARSEMAHPIFFNQADLPAEPFCTDNPPAK
jgi:hypothetical protein